MALYRTDLRRYLVRSKYVELNHAEYEVTKYSIAFLCTEACLNHVDSSQRRKYVRQGYYSFYDYAVACWSLHFQSAIGTTQTQKSIEILAEYFGIFLDLHWSKAAEEQTVSSAIKDKLDAFRKFDCFAKLTEAFVSARKQLGIHYKGPSPSEPLDLSSTTMAIREVVEGINLPRHAPELEEFYGTKSFKCPRVNCFKFYDGFSSQAERDRHVDKHDRPYTCSIPDCQMGIVGYSTEKALQKHMFDLHGVDPGAHLEFPAPPREPAKRTAEAVFGCPHCPKKFTRAFTLRGHVRTHENSKPFACNTRGKQFARYTDCKRHEGIHSDKRTFICSGTLAAGTPWGCKRAFNRADKLRGHHQSQSGRRCIAGWRAEQDSRHGTLATITTKLVENEANIDNALETTSQEDEVMSDAQWEELFDSLVQVEEGEMERMVEPF